MTQHNSTGQRCPLCDYAVNPKRQNHCPGCTAPLRSATFRQLLEADQALQACQRSYDALAQTWTQWGERRAALVEQLAAERARTVPGSAPARAASAPDTPAVTEPVAESVATEPAVTVTPEPVTPEPVTPKAVTPPSAESPADPFAAPGGSTPKPASASAVSTPAPARTQATPKRAPARPARAPRRRMAEVFTAPVLLGVSGASLMIAAAIVAVAITWATATPVVRGLLVLVVAGAVGALAVWLRRLHLVITSGSVGVVAMGFAGTSAVAFLGESPSLSDYSTAVAFLIASAAGIGLARLRLAWVGPGSAVALAGFAVALTITVTVQAADATTLWAWSVTGVVTALGLAATYALWPWKSAQQIVLWGALGWICVTGTVAALWLWFGDVAVGNAWAALVPIAALVLLARWWRPVPVIAAVVLTTIAAPGIAYVIGTSAWQQITVVAATLVVAVGVGAGVPTTVRRLMLAAMSPAYAVVAVATVGYAFIGLAQRTETLLSARADASRSDFVFDAWGGVAALLLAVAIAGLRTWKLPALAISARAQQLLAVTGPLAAIASVTVATLTITDLTADAWATWVWVVTGVGLALVLGLTRKVWPWEQSQRIVLWAAVVWIGIVGVVTAVWAWSGELALAESFAGLVPIVALVTLVRWLPRTSVIIAVALATWMGSTIAFVAGTTAWQQLAVAAAVIAVGVAVGAGVSTAHRGSIALGLSPAFVVVAVSTAVYAVVSLFTRGTLAITGSLAVNGPYASTPGTVEVWAGVAALIVGLSVAGLRYWRLRELGRDIAGWLRAGAIVGALMVVAGVVIIGTAVADMAPGASAHSALASALSIAAVVLMVARRLWVDVAAKNVSSTAGVVLAALAGLHGSWGLAVGELPVLAGLGIALAPVLVLAAWGIKRPAQGTGLAVLLATVVAACLALALGATALPALAAAVAVAAVVVWAVRLAPARQQELMLIGVVPALAWGVITGLWTAVNVVGWLDSARWTPQLWPAITALLMAIALAATRTGPWRSQTRLAEPVGAVLVLVAAPVALAVGADTVELNVSAFALGSALAGAVVAATGLAWWKNRLARRLTRIGVVLWVAAAGFMGWVSVAYSSWDFTTTLVLSAVALVLLVALSRWWPRVALAPTALMLTVAPLTGAVRAGWGLTATVVAMVAGAVLVLAVLTVVPTRLRYIGLLGALPALITGGVGTAIVAMVGAGEALMAGRIVPSLTSHWWALGLTGVFGVAMMLLRRLQMRPAAAVVAQYVGALTVVAATIVSTATLAMLAAPDQLGAPSRLLLAPVMGAVLGAAVFAWTVRAAQGKPAQVRSAPEAAEQVASDQSATPIDFTAGALAIARWGVVAWVVALALGLQVWIRLGDVAWHVGGGIVLALAMGLVAVGRRWPYGGLLPATALVTLLPFAVMPVVMDVPLAAAACIATVVVAAVTWLSRRSAPNHRRAVLMGLVPTAIGAGVPLLSAIILTLVAVAEHLWGTTSLDGVADASSLTWWHVGGLAAGSVAVLAWRGGVRLRGWLLLGVVVVTAALLPPLWAVVLLTCTALGLLFGGTWLRSGNIAAGIAVAFALVWSVGSDIALGLTSATATVIAGTVALGWRTRARTWGAVVAPVTALMAGVFVARALDATTVAVPAGIGLSMVAVLALVSADRDRLRTPVAAIAAVLTVGVPLMADTTAMVGLAYVLGAATWWRLFSAGLSWAKWMCAATASAGAAALVASIDIQIIEAYTAVPAAALLLIGLQWMRERPELRSLTALAPGLGAMLVPSYLALVLEPDALWRTIVLIIATISLALIGLRLRWFAPILGTAVTAVVLSVLQIIAGGNVVVRLVAFAVVGALLLGIASYFEKLKELR